MELDDFDENELFVDIPNEEEDEVQRTTESEADSKKMTDEEKKKLLESVWEQTEKEIKKKAQPRKPRPKLTERELLSEKGIPALKAMFDEYKFPEEMDPYAKLNVLLGKMEFWTHNLFPSMTFSDCLDKFERIGRTRVAKNAIRRLRIGMPLDDEHMDKNDGGQGEKKEEEDEQIEDEGDTDNPAEEAPSVVRNEMDNDGEETDDLDDFFERMRRERENGAGKGVEDDAIDPVPNEYKKGGSSTVTHSDSGSSDEERKFSANKRRKIIIDDDDF